MEFKAIAVCDEHLLSAMRWITEGDLKTNHKYKVRIFKEPDDHYHCTCKASATYFIRRLEEDE